MTEDRKPTELPPAFRPFAAAQAANKNLASAIASAVRVQDLIPAYKPFIASDAMRDVFTNTAVLSKILADRPALPKIAVDTSVFSNMVTAAKAFESLQPKASSILASTVASSALSAQLADARVAEQDLSDIWSAQVRHRADVDQAALDNADATAALVKVAHKQERALESTAGLIAVLVEEQRRRADEESRATRINRRWLIVGIAIATISAVAGVVNLVVNWPH